MKIARAKRREPSSAFHANLSGAPVVSQRKAATGAPTRGSEEEAMRVGDLMVSDVKAVAPDMTVADAVALMTEHHISALPVVDAHSHLLGVLSTTDVLQAVAEATDGRSRELLLQGDVRDLMTPRPATVRLETDVKEAAQQMLYLEVHRLFVEDQGQLVGVISQSDIVRGVATAKI
jgi:CBS domain-containing membrane protein